MTGKTLKELNVQPGDVVSSPYYDKVPMTVLEFSSAFPGEYSFEQYVIPPNESGFTLVSRASDTPKLWRDMTPEEKGALLLAHHEKKGIDFWNDGEWDDSSPAWHPDNAYRIRPEPKVEAVAFEHAGCRFTFSRIDGDPDCDSVKMEEL